VIGYVSENSIAFITLGEEPGGVVLNTDTIGRLLRGIRRAGEDEAVRVVVLRSAGGAFCLGMDLDAAVGDGTVPSDVSGACTLFVELLLSIVGLPKPVVCILQGDAIGGGIGLAGACDVVIASEDVVLQFSEVLYGLIPAMIAPVLCPRRMSAASLGRYAMGARRLDAHTARSAGLIDEVEPALALEQRAREIIRSLLRASPRALAALKSQMGELGAGTIRERIESGRSALLSLLTQVEPAQARAAYAQGRLPDWALRLSPRLSLLVNGGDRR